MTSPESSSSGRPLVSRRAFRAMERNSQTILALSSFDKFSYVSRLALTSNEILRQICNRKVDENSLNTLAKFFINNSGLRNENSESLIYLAKSIHSIGQSIGGYERDDTIETISIAPLDNYDDIDRRINRHATVSTINQETKEEITVSVKKDESTASMKKEDDTVSNEGEGSSKNTVSINNDQDKGKEVEGLSNDANDMPVLFSDTMLDPIAAGITVEEAIGSSNDWCASLVPQVRYRSISPINERKRKHSECTPPPSPNNNVNIMKKDDDDEYDELMDVNGIPIFNTSKNLTGKKKPRVNCQMCDVYFHTQSQVNKHLLEYHRIKPLTPVEAQQMEERDRQYRIAARQLHDLNHMTTVNKPSTSSVSSTVMKQSRPSTSQFVRPTTRPCPEASEGSSTMTSSTTDDKIHAILATVSNAFGGPPTIPRHTTTANGVIRTVPTPRPYACRQCGQILSSQQMYASHVRYAHPKEKDPNAPSTPNAPSVRVRNPTKESVIVHHTTADGSKIYTCRRCNKVFNSAPQVAGHARHCLLVFQGLKKPTKEHVSMPPNARAETFLRCGLSTVLARTCPYCGETFPSIRKVDKHVRHTHTTVRHEVYGCTSCVRRFVTLGGIENHWLHYGDCPTGSLLIYKDDGEVIQVRKSEEEEEVEVEGGDGIEEGEMDTVDGDEDVVEGDISEEEEGLVIDEDDEVFDEVDEDIHGREVVEDGIDEYNDISPQMGIIVNEDEEDICDDDDDEQPPILHNEVKKDKVVFSVRVLSCRFCDFAARSRDTMNEHMAEVHPDEVESSLSPIDNGKRIVKREEEDDDYDDYEMNDVSPNGIDEEGEDTTSDTTANVSSGDDEKLTNGIKVKSNA